MPDLIAPGAPAEPPVRAAAQAAEPLARAVDDAAAAVRELADGPRKAAEDLRAAVEAAHRAALVTIVRRLRADSAARELLYELVDDPLIRMLFSLHGIIRSGTPEGVGAAGEHTSGQPSGGACGCGGQHDGGCACGHSHGSAGQAGPTLIPLSAIGHRHSPGLATGGAA